MDYEMLVQVAMPVKLNAPLTKLHTRLECSRPDVDLLDQEPGDPDADPQMTDCNQNQFSINYDTNQHVNQ